MNTHDTYPGRLSPADYAQPEPPDGPGAADFCRGCGEENGMDDEPFCYGWCRDCRCPQCETPLEHGRPRRGLCEGCEMDERGRREDREQAVSWRQRPQHEELP